MQKKVETYILQLNMIERGDKVLAGVSGGGDSMALLFLLNALQTKIGFSLQAVHVNHGLRGEEAQKDQKLVEETCSRLDICCRSFFYPVDEIAKERKMGTEEAGRMVRQETFALCAKQWGGNVKIALAHHQNDLAETMLHNLARGTGLMGLTGIRPVQGDYIRPLLCVQRKEIEKYLEEEEIPFRTDSSNFSQDYTRNRIRHQILRTMEEQINPETVSHMAHTAAQALLAEEYFRSEAGRHLKLCSRMAGNKREILFREGFLELPEILQNYVVKLAIEAAAKARKDLTGEHVLSVCQLKDRQVGKMVCLPYGILARRTYEGIEILRKEKDQEPDMGAEKEQNRYWMSNGVWCRTLEIPGHCRHAGGLLEARLISYNKNQQIPEKTYTKWLDYDKIENTLEIRTRREGDYYILDEQGRQKKLNRYFIDEKIPREYRDRVLLVTDGSQILWMPGGRIGARYKISDTTRQVLELKYQGGEIHE